MALKLSIRTVIAGIVVCVWTVTTLTSIITKDYTSLGAVTPVMMIVVGFLFGTRSNGNSSPPAQSIPPAKEEEGK